ncbi:MAG: hypothetical protein LBH06_04260, partial [Rikenellaceae bacterium]|nr:hypothetical protein [Rikenellaceae bacterium]
MAEANKQIVMMNREEDSTFDLKLLFTIFSKWPLFVVSVVCFMTLAELYYRSRTPMFETSASVIVEQTRNAPEEQMLLQGMGFTNTLRNNIDNEIGVLSSPNLVGKLVRDMHLYADYRWDDNVITYRQNLYKDTPIMVMFVGEDMGRMPSAELHITCSGSGVYNVEAQYRKEKRKIVEAHRLALLPARITIDGAQFEVSRNDSIPFDGQRLMVRLTNPDIVTAHYVKSLNITTSAQFSTQLN